MTGLCAINTKTNHKSTERLFREVYPGRSVRSRGAQNDKRQGGHPERSEGSLGRVFHFRLHFSCSSCSSSRISKIEIIGSRRTKMKIKKRKRPIVPTKTE